MQLPSKLCEYSFNKKSTPPTIHMFSLSPKLLFLLYILPLASVCSSVCVPPVFSKRLTHQERVLSHPSTAEGPSGPDLPALRQLQALLTRNSHIYTARSEKMQIQQSRSTAVQSTPPAPCGPDPRVTARSRPRVAIGGQKGAGVSVWESN